MRDGKADFECSEFSYTPGEKGVRVYRFRPSVDLSFDKMGIVLNALGGVEFIVKKMGIDKIVIRRSLVNLVFRKPISDCSVLVIDMAENQLVRLSTTGGGIRQEIDRKNFSSLESMSRIVAENFKMKIPDSAVFDDLSLESHESDRPTEVLTDDHPEPSDNLLSMI